jgi:phospho-N-acetylmuramoyl-pentapeptide-transferase
MFDWLGSGIGADSPFSFLRVFEYLSVRSVLALGFSFLFCLLLGPWTIRRLQRLQAIQYIKECTGKDAVNPAEMHALKAGTPTMGGLLMFASLAVSSLLFADLRSPIFWIAMITTVGYCGIGFLDDYLKCVKKNNDGLSGRNKLLCQFAVGIVFAILYAYVFPHLVEYTPSLKESEMTINGPGFLLFPFFKQFVLQMGIFYVPFAIFVLMATSNGVNLTDGLDGLAAGVTIPVCLCFAVVAYFTGRIDASEYLIIPYVVGAGELTVLVAAVIGSCLGFLWFNSHPAEMFMGDTGSMMLGGLIGAVALLTKQEILLVVVGGIFVAETVSVILQVGSYKLRGKRIFRMAPIHHHFEKGGLKESKIIARFYIVAALLALLGLLMLKFR